MTCPQAPWQFQVHHPIPCGESLNLHPQLSSTSISLLSRSFSSHLLPSEELAHLTLEAEKFHRPQAGDPRKGSDVIQSSTQRPDWQGSSVPIGGLSTQCHLWNILAIEQTAHECDKVSRANHKFPEKEGTRGMRDCVNGMTTILSVGNPKGPINEYIVWKEHGEAGYI